MTSIAVNILEWRTLCPVTQHVADGSDIILALPWSYSRLDHTSPAVSYTIHQLCLILSGVAATYVASMLAICQCHCPTYNSALSCTVFLAI